MKVSIVTLGCPKNEVDSELLSAKGRAFGWELVSAPEQAEAVVVNTCGFIEPAVEESVDTILELAQMKQQGRIRFLVAAGCMVQRYKDELASLIPEVDLFVGSADHGKIPKLLDELERARMDRPKLEISSKPDGLFEDDQYALLNRRPNTNSLAYVRLAEGCSRRCSFCIIPALRGSQRSRSMNSIVSEVAMLHERFGTREFVLVAQETTAYGKDRDDGANLVSLLEALLGLDGKFWIRLMYAHPLTVTKDLVEFYAQNASAERLVPYIDMPIQHADSRVLKLMRRGYDERKLRRLLEHLRQKIPNLMLRTTYMVGHPGEDSRAYLRLKKLVEEGWFDYAGAFVFYPEEGSVSAGLRPKPRQSTARRRWNELLAIQRQVSSKNLERFVGSSQQVLVESFATEEGVLPVGRFYGQAPEIDGVVYLSGDADAARIGQFAQVKVANVMEFDLEGELVADGEE